ncbi:hypothetical protein CEXT_722211 [Caerostris extrusa]|uniref:Uncharacterized protein n=1 Tax=Caerostris extrusa TaxID=172846 RepID=A0AAV4Y2A5_CAEEX|nr:hypothetical protein CEXT_722211 [Caerostris extrusa]
MMTGDIPCLPHTRVCPLALYEDECHIDNALTCPDVRTCRSGRTGVNGVCRRNLSCSSGKGCSYRFIMVTSETRICHRRTWVVWLRYGGRSCVLVWMVLGVIDTEILRLIWNGVVQRTEYWKII